MFPSMLGPPSRVATSTARSSLPNMRPRFSSVAAFFRLICAHLEWPAIAPLSPIPRFVCHGEQPLMQALVTRDLRMKRRGHQLALPNQHGLSRVLAQDLDCRAQLRDDRGPDEHGPDRTHALHLHVGLEGVHLPPVSVAPHG